MAMEVLVVIHRVFIEIVMHQQLIICLPTPILVYTLALFWATSLLMMHPILVAIILLLVPISPSAYEALCGLIKRWLGGITWRIAWHQSTISLCNERKKRKNAVHRGPCMIQQVWVVRQWTKRNNEKMKWVPGGGGTYLWRVSRWVSTKKDLACLQFTNAASWIYEGKQLMAQNSASCLQFFLCYRVYTRYWYQYWYQYWYWYGTGCEHTVQGWQPCMWQIFIESGYELSV